MDGGICSIYGGIKKCNSVQNIIRNMKRKELFGDLCAWIFLEGSRSRCYRRTAVLRLTVQPCDEDD
jgi:hypothetical protein